MSPPRWLTPRRALVVGIGAVILVLILRDIWTHGGVSNLLSRAVPEDFDVVPVARDRIAQGLDPYVQADQWPYKYAPIAALSYFVLPASHALDWLIFETVLLVGWGAALVFGSGPPSWRTSGWVGVGVLLSIKGVTECLGWGQLDFVYLIAATVAALQLRRRPLVAGLILGVLPWLKLPWGFVAVPFVADCLRKEGLFSRSLGRLVAGGLSSSLLCLALIPAALVGWERTLELTRSWHRLVREQPAALFADFWNQSLWAALPRWLGPWGASIGAKALAAAAIAGTIGLLLGPLARRFEPRDGIAWVGPWLLLTQLISPLGWSWGTLLVVGLPLAAAPRPGERASRVLWVFCPCVAILCCLQQTPVTQRLGLGRWDALLPYSDITAYWLLLLGLVLLPRRPLAAGGGARSLAASSPGMG